LSLKHFDKLELLSADIGVVSDIGRIDFPAGWSGGGMLEMTVLVGARRSPMGSTRDRESNGNARDQAYRRDEGGSQAAETHHWIRLSPRTAPATVFASSVAGHPTTTVNPWSPT